MKNLLSEVTIKRKIWRWRRLFTYNRSAARQRRGVHFFVPRLLNPSNRRSHPSLACPRIQVAWGRIPIECRSCFFLKETQADVVRTKTKKISSSINVAVLLVSHLSSFLFPKKKKIIFSSPFKTFFSSCPLRPASSVILSFSDHQSIEETWEKCQPLLFYPHKKSIYLFLKPNSLVLENLTSVLWTCPLLPLSSMSHLEILNCWQNGAIKYFFRQS